MFDAFTDEFAKLATWSMAQITYLKSKFHVPDSAFDSMVRRASGSSSTSTLTASQLESLARMIVAKYVVTKMPTANKTLPLKSDISRSSDRKKLLIGVKREKGALKLDLMQRIKKKNRLSTRPFKAIRQKQRSTRLGLVRGTRQQARKGYKRR